MNDYNRNLYHDEVAALINRLNVVLAEGSETLYAPHIKFNRNIGKWAGVKVNPRTGAELSEREYAEQFDDFMPTAEDKKLLLEIIGNEKEWIVPKLGSRDPLETIGEPRRSAINL